MVRQSVAVKAVLALVIAGVACLPPTPTPAGDGVAVQLSESRQLMATTVRIELVAASEPSGRRAIAAAFAEMARLEEVLSVWSETSQISRVNRAAGSHPVSIDPELYEVVVEATRISELTGGAFDITFAGCGRLWSVRQRRIPSEAEIAACLDRVDYRRLEVDPQRLALYLPLQGMRIGLDALAKGYRVDRAVAVLESHGIADYLVDAGGDLRLAGAGLEGAWAVEIAHPRQAGRNLGRLVLERGAIVTSGDYQWFFERDGVRYHHIIDPRTGRPARRAVAATVVAPNAMTADALATGLFVLGAQPALALVERLPGVEALVVDAALETHLSSGFLLDSDLLSANGGRL